ncbi:hypothetical protein [Klebsiella variicola]|uniref:hypothetical protein n=1 Tax=Klebsiella variicola TaxID=244366 RepID=UPI002181349C|nr:hypothetical protein [Klebsiella variicola]GKO68973.1 hypothetical protein MS6016_48140 [Klebsiella variicola]
MISRPKISDDIKFAVDEHIWGHRLHDAQLPYLVFLEFLNVFLHNLESPFEVDEDGCAEYIPQRQLVLRHILFNNPMVDVIASMKTADEDKWSKWESQFLDTAVGLELDSLKHLKESFYSFDDFYRAVDLLRSSAFEAKSNKRWSSKFVFPYGPDTLYEDLKVDSSGNCTNDRIFFGRSGELLYLMLSRATDAQKLANLIKVRLFDESAQLNRLAKAIQGPRQLSTTTKKTGYLPAGHKARYEHMCHDWIAILSRDMPIDDAIEHLVTSIGLNLILYFIEQGKMTAGDTAPLELLCEIVSSNRTKVRALSSDSWQQNQAMSMRAIRTSIESIQHMPEWQTALVSSNPIESCAELTRAMFQWPTDETRFNNHEPKSLISELLESAEFRHVKHIGKIHSSWSRAIGLSSRRLSRRTRYAPSDRLLKTLVITVVQEPMEFTDFLSKLRERYGLIFGDVEGERFVKENLVDQEALSDNASRLESRLLGLGLLRRLSDACSFVENPFFSEASNAR